MKTPASCFAVMLVAAVPLSSGANEQFVYFGTEGGSIYVSRLDLETGRLSPAERACDLARPGFLAWHPSKKWMYSVTVLPKGTRKTNGGVAALAVNAVNGQLTVINIQPTGGSGACHVSVDHTGKCVMVAHYGSGSVALLPLGDDGSLKPTATVIAHEGSSVDPQRQRRPHAHSINPDPSNRFALAADLGIDKLLVYKLEAATAKMTVHGFGQLPPGSGPRHITFHPSGKFVYVINELSSTITVMAFDDQKGTVEARQTISTLPADFKQSNSTAEVQFHPGGRFVYGSNRGHDSIAVFACDATTGKLTFVECEPIRGKTPRNFRIDPTGRYLIAAGQNSNSAAVFRVDEKTGGLQFTGSKIEVPRPICVKFLPIK